MTSTFKIISFVIGITLPALAFAGNETIVFKGGSILPVDEKFSTQQAMVVRGKRIVAVGDYEDVIRQAGNAPVIIDLEGGVVLPAFIDAHTHPVAGAAANVFENIGVDRFLNVDEAIEHMIDVSGSNTQSDWLLFINLDLATQAYNQSAITSRILDGISKNRPVVVWHAGGHKMTVNSRMLEIMDITAGTTNPAGSEYGRYDDGTPDGNLSGNAALFGALGKIEPYVSFDRKSGAISLSEKWVAQGMATLGIAGVSSPEDWKVIIALAADENFPMRTRNYLQWAGLTGWDAAFITPGLGDEYARAIGYKISVDGSNQAYTGLQREPYLGQETKGLPYMLQEEIDRAITEGTKRGAQMAMHGNGDAGIDNIISAVAKARAEGVEVIRPRIEHCSVVQDDQLQKLTDHGISCSFLIAHVLYWGQAFRDKVFGPEKAAKLDRAGTFEREGIPFSLHTDYGVSVLSPLEMIEVAVTRTLFTEPGTVLAPDERSSVEAAIRGVTSVAAWQLMSDYEIGTLEAGKLADFVVLDADPRKVEADKIGEIRVVETWIDGKQVYRSAL
jgi:predicted amidohydrolase YtcJ